MEQQHYFTPGPQRIQQLKEMGKDGEAAEAIRLGLEQNPQALQLELPLRLQALPSGTTLILFSDHGFIGNPGTGNGKPRPWRS